MEKSAASRPLAVTILSDDGSGPRRFELSSDGQKAITIGRVKGSDVLLTMPGASNSHCALRPTGRGGIVVCDSSSNGTGLQEPYGETQKLEKGKDTVVPSGSLVVIPLRIKEGGERVCFMVHFGEPLGDPTAVKLPGLRLPASATALEPEASQIKSAAAASAATLPGPEPEPAPARAAAPPPGATAPQQASRKEEGKTDSRANDEEVGSARRPRASVVEEKDVKVGKRRCSRSESAGRSESRNRKRRKQRSPSHRNRREDKKKDRDRERRSRSRGRGHHHSNSRRRSRDRAKEKVVGKDSRRDFKEESSRFRDRDTRKGSTPMGFRELASRKREERSSPPPSPPAGVPPRQEAPPGPPPLPRAPSPPRPADDTPEEKPPPPPPETAPAPPQSLGSLLSGGGLLSSVQKELAASRQDAEREKPSPRRPDKSPSPAGKAQAGKSASAEPTRRRRASRWGAPTDEAPPPQPPEPAPPAQPAAPPPQPAATAPPQDAAPSPPPGPAAAKAPPPPQAASPPAGPPAVTDTAKQAGIIAMTQQLQLAQTQYAAVYAQAQQLLATVGQANPQYQHAFALAQQCQQRVQSAELALRQVQQGGAVPAAAPAQMPASQTPGNQAGMQVTAEVPTLAKAPMQVSQQIAGDPLAAGVCKAKGCGARPFSAPTEAPLPTDFALVGKAKATAPPPRPQSGGAVITSLDAVPPKSVGVDLVSGGGASTYAKSMARPPPRHDESVDADGGQDADREKNNSFRQGGGLANLNCRSKGGEKGSGTTDKGGWKGKEKGAGKEDRGGWKGGDTWNDGGKGGGKDSGKAKGKDWDGDRGNGMRGSGGNNKGGWDPDHPPWRGGGGRDRATRWDDA